MVERTIHTGRLELAFKESGNPDGIPVIELHGWLDNANSFDRMNASLDPDRLRTIALDLPGHGFSEHRSKSENYHLLEYVLDVEAFARAMGLKKIFVVGHSLGGVIGSLWASACPERVSGLVMIDAIGPISSKEEESAQQLGSAIQKILTPSRPLTVFPSRDEAIAARKMGMGNLTEESISVLLERGLKKVPGGYVWASDPRLRHLSLMRLSEIQVRAFLGAIQCRVLGLFAQGSALAANHRFTERLSVIPDFRYEILEGGHHLHLQECPAAIGSRVNQFIQ